MKPMLLIILDGWGVREAAQHNSVKNARLPQFNGFLERYPWTTVETHGEAVGLMPGVMGNSEVGHTNIGAGRIVYQLLTRISHAIDDGSFFDNEVLIAAINRCKQNDSALHLLGLLSDAGVHSHQKHLEALLELAKRHGLKSVFVHPFMDGRDTNPKSGADYLRYLERTIEQVGIGKIATLCGRYYAMDRDKRWDRTKRAYDAIVHGQGHQTSEDPVAVMQAWYDTPDPQPGFGDEFTPPTVFVDPESQTPLACVRDDDVVIHGNFRPDRARQLTEALSDPNFTEFDRGRVPRLGNFTCMASYSDDYDLPVAFNKEELTQTLPELIAARGIHQFRCAETEKYAHVTYFFNGGDEQVFNGEDRQLIPSNREVSTYDLAPEMRAREVTDAVLKALDSDRYGFLVVNFANPDMVGHTGKEPAVIQALETIDHCLGQLANKVLEQDGHVIITADHGNCEEMVDANGLPHTQHTLNPVPLILIGDDVGGIKLHPGRLCDIAPTILEIMKIEQPSEMTGRSLID